MSLALQSIHIFPQQRSRTSSLLQRETPTAVNFVKLNKKLLRMTQGTTRMCLVSEHEAIHPACGVEEKDGVIIVDHGSRRKESNLMLRRHWIQDIPKLAHDAAMDFPGISYLVTAPLGLHSRLVD
ncbi:hypothetical protein V2J09_021402 [Rumex salicifolius]